MIIGILIILLAGIAWLVKVYHIAATDPGAAGYQSVLSMLVAAVAGKGVFYYVTIALHFAGPGAFRQHRLRRSAAPVPHHRVGWLFAEVSGQPRPPPGVFRGNLGANRALAGVLLILFGGVTDRLIPLYAVGAFLAFTLSQLGMVFHWRRVRGPHADALHVDQRTGWHGHRESRCWWCWWRSLSMAPGSPCS